jgi:hypothetical protein
MQPIDNDVARHRRLPGPAARAFVRWAVRLRLADHRALALVLLVLCLGAVPLSLRAAGGDQSAASHSALESTTSTLSGRSSARSTGSSGSFGETSADRSSEAASRSKSREAPATSPSASAKQKSKASPKSAGPVRPVAGLTQVQMDHAKTIVEVGEQLDMPKRAYVVAVATSMQETNLLNLANGWLPESLGFKNDGTGYDHDSVGLFQQRPASGWGSVQELMDPATSARKFYQALSRIPGWDTWSLTVAAQTVQGSAFPDAYAKHETRAAVVVDALTR